MSEQCFTDSTITVRVGEVWTVREWYDGSWDIIDAKGDRQGRFASKRMMGIHTAMAIAEEQRLRTGLGFISQLLSDRVPSMIAQATLDGANLLDEDVAIDVCEGHWRKP